MPRKTNGMPFEAHPSPRKDENGEKLLYVKPLSGLKMTLDDIENYCSSGYSLRKGDMTRVFETFKEVAAIFMAKGYRIETPIGAFAPKIALKRHESNPDNIKHDDVELEGIDFQSVKPFEKALERRIGHVGFRYVRKATSSRLMENEQRMEEALRNSLKANAGYTTVASFAYHSGLTEHSARKKLERWCFGNTPKLQRSHIGRAFIYTEV